ncbi:hypothetical protein N0V84_012267 [Fusarium piperis]|uniref:Uncharacterized protein n=1 Tax=Fusarium piperis TaxID=1435070 RepID=A0A9W8W3V8_9HYPO|nr:hypothetical protein N0V84_012267 [Fusarium piperis]
MKFTQSIIALAALVNGINAACQIGASIDMNCCWGGKQGSDACSRQAKSVICSIDGKSKDFCRNIGIPSSKCNADCCDTRTGWGKPCPKGKNACDPDFGCPN